MASSGVAPKNNEVTLDVEARDRKTLEIRQFFPLPQNGNEYEYLTDVYFFFPLGFGVGRQSLKRDEFYRRSKIYMRLHCPHLPLKELVNLRNEEHPAAILRRQLPLLLSREAPPGESLTALAQLLGAEVSDAIKVGIQKIIAQLKSTEHQERALPELARNVSQYCEEVLLSLGALRRVRTKALAHGAITHQQLQDALLFGCEYAGAVIDESLASLAVALDNSHTARDGTGLLTAMRLDVSKTAELVNHWRIDQGFLVPWRVDEELFTYRMSLLKKELQQSLYIDTRQVKRDPFVRNTAAMVAAGLAATWATLAQLPLWTGGWATEEGALFLGIAVGAYILKDRIKEWARNSLSKYWLSWDKDRRIVGDNLLQVGFGAFTGRAKERFEFLEDEAVPEEIKKIRLKERTVSGLTIENENVVHYQRALKFSSAKSQAVPKRYGVQERFRLNLNGFLAGLDDPTENIRYFDSRTGRFREKEMPRVYHLNLVVVQQREDGKDSKFRKLRLIVNQKGVVRIEPVSLKDEGV